MVKCEGYIGQCCKADYFICNSLLSFTFTLVAHPLTKYQVNCALQTQNLHKFRRRRSTLSKNASTKEAELVRIKEQTSTHHHLTINIERLWPPLGSARFRTRTSKDRAINFLLPLIFTITKCPFYIWTLSSITQSFEGCSSEKPVKVHFVPDHRFGYNVSGQYQNTNVQNTNDHNTSKMVFWSFFLLVFLAVGIMNLVGEHLLVFWLLIGILIAHWYFDHSLVFWSLICFEQMLALWFWKWQWKWPIENPTDHLWIRKVLAIPQSQNLSCLLDNKQSDRLNWFQTPVFWTCVALC